MSKTIYQAKRQVSFDLPIKAKLLAPNEGMLKHVILGPWNDGRGNYGNHGLSQDGSTMYVIAAAKHPFNEQPTIIPSCYAIPLQQILESLIPQIFEEKKGIIIQ